jgi:uncharacterized SAM-binding protein YcdF (DUF218 family)
LLLLAKSTITIVMTAGAVRQILTSTADAGGTDRHNPDRDRLLQFGIPAAAIITFGNDPKNTYEEALALAHWAMLSGAKRIIIPTETFSSRRVQWILRKELGNVGVHVMIETLSPPGYDLSDWSQHKTGSVDFQTELIKYLYYRVRYWRS